MPIVRTLASLTGVIECPFNASFIVFILSYLEKSPESYIGLLLVELAILGDTVRQ
jgi:hypothetical protein